MALALSSIRGLALVVAVAVLVAPTAVGAFDRDAWTGGVQDDGTYRLTCARGGCSDDTFMTFRRRPAHAIADAAAYDRSIAGAVPELRKRGITAETTPAVRSQVARFVLYRATRTLTLPDGRRQYYVAGMLVGDDYSLSLMAVAPAAGLAARNFDGLADYLAHHPPKFPDER